MRGVLALVAVVGVRGHGKFGFVAAFAVLSLLPIVALGVGLGQVLNQDVRQHDLVDANRTAVLLAHSGVEPFLVSSDLSDGLTPERLAQLDYDLKGLAFGKEVARLKIWNPAGTVVYSDNHSLVARTFAIDDHLGDALRGTPGSEIGAGSAPENRADNLRGQFLSVYVPIYFEGQSKPAGAFELYLPWEPVQAQIDRESWNLYLWLGAGLAALYALMLPIVVVADRWRRRLSTSLAETDAERGRAAEAARLSELKSIFLAGMSHELRTPLNAILGFAQLLGPAGSDRLTDKQAHYVGNIEKAGRHLLAVVGDVLDLSKIEAGRMDISIRAMALEPTVASVAEILQPMADAKCLSFAVEAEPGLWVAADELRLVQVLVNVVTNAIKFTPAEGSVTVSARATGDHVDLLVKDTGAGITELDRAAIFDEFVQGAAHERRSDGTGLGLPLSRRLVELMDGHLELLDSSPAGSTFRIRIPKAQVPVLAEPTLV